MGKPLFKVGILTVGNLQLTVYKIENIIDQIFLSKICLFKITKKMFNLKKIFFVIYLAFKISFSQY